MTSGSALPTASGAEGVRGRGKEAKGISIPMEAALSQLSLIHTFRPAHPCSRHQDQLHSADQAKHRTLSSAVSEGQGLY